ncbi:MAG: Helix-turn-helix domain [Pseudomonadota bacterium]|jgi:hypothetical protein
MTRHIVKEKVRTALLNGERISSRDAYFRFDCYHLASVIRSLRQEGMAINTHKVFAHKDKGRAVVFAEYALADVSH